MKYSTKENKNSFQKKTRKGTNEITKRKNTPKKIVLEVRTTGNLENETTKEEIRWHSEAMNAATYPTPIEVLCQIRDHSMPRRW